MNTDEREFSLTQVGEENGIQFTLAHDIMFGMVMQDKDICKGLLERIFPERKVKELKFCSHSNVELQKAINTGQRCIALKILTRKIACHWGMIRINLY